MMNENCQRMIDTLRYFGTVSVEFGEFTKIQNVTILQSNISIYIGEGDGRFFLAESDDLQSALMKALRKAVDMNEKAASIDMRPPFMTDDNRVIGLR